MFSLFWHRCDAHMLPHTAACILRLIRTSGKDRAALPSTLARISRRTVRGGNTQQMALLVAHILACAATYGSATDHRASCQAA